mmetsp:Transcript_34357/g.97596  ORF Transcript_34357/g.97596 Transcript_34357/m.97596 type:complete len:353 (+) Transcript_34357:74-1132(+)|eukprot:CAMPEP_0176224344 /NCGR_PEP_ID=MMETSP0121_2-20121125/21206_1 /TAXON_ID=160619 /ORGANISM="Kryptoperidinium foliaceum, Strain CCMP 1326" /LENGTH=352 /DNA_ID=CAMNT_0017563595 /DNA_START=65 /DNA_END=1123 /DNA_ORIENTATION=-
MALAPQLLQQHMAYCGAPMAAVQQQMCMQMAAPGMAQIQHLQNSAMQAYFVAAQTGQMTPAMMSAAIQAQTGRGIWPEMCGAARHPFSTLPPPQQPPAGAQTARDDSSLAGVASGAAGGLSFADVEARLRQSWENLPAEQQNQQQTRNEASSTAPGASSSSAGAAEVGSDSPELARAVAAMSAAQAEATPSAQPLTQRRLRSDAVFCPSCTARARCRFHSVDDDPAASVRSERLAAAPGADETHKALLAMAHHLSMSSTQDFGGRRTGDGRNRKSGVGSRLVLWNGKADAVDDSGEDMSTEAGSSETWLGGAYSDEWSDAGGETSAAVAAVSAAALAAPRTDARASEGPSAR